MHRMNSIRRLLTVATTLAAAWAWSAPAWSLGLGRPESQAVLGDTLRVVVPLRLENGETITQECVSAEVHFGDDRVASAAVSVALEPAETVTAGMGARLVLRTTALINEPVVNVLVSAGCQARISRRFVALADPPGSPLPVLAQGSVQVVQPLTSEPVVLPSRARKAGAADVGSGRLAAGLSRNDRASPSVGSTSGKSARRQPTQKAPIDAPRLALDPVDADAWVQPSLRPTAQMNSPISGDAAASEVQARRDAAAALWRALNATPADMLRQQQHVQALEQRLQALQRSSEQTQQSVTTLQARMQALEQPARSTWHWPVVLATLAVIALTGWMLHGWGVRRGREQASAWWSPDAAQSALDSTKAEVNPVASGLASDVDLLGPIPDLDEDDGLPAPEPTPPSANAGSAEPPSSLSAALLAPEPLKAVSVEELIDLEQQAEFFIVLGQDDAAIELLESHLGGHTREIPWPYLKLMEVYRRLGRRTDYERVQERFNAHFNGRAPTWDSDMEQGRSLADYPGVIERVQALWAEPSRAMGVLEMSLVHLGPDADAFDLPAYRELLFLYAVARDLSDRAERRQAAASDMSPLMATQPVRSVRDGVAPEPLSVDLDLDRLDDKA